MNKPAVIAFWHRRDLRLNDNAGLYHALKAAKEQGVKVLPVFIFDTDILDHLPNLDYRVIFVHRYVSRLALDYIVRGSMLVAQHGKPLEVWEQLMQQYDIKAVYTNRDYEPYALERDRTVESLLKQQGATFHHFKDHVVFDGNEVMTQLGTPFKVFTPYKTAWLDKVTPEMLKPYASEENLDALHKVPVAEPIPSLADMGFEDSADADALFPSSYIPDTLMRYYATRRDFPAAPEGTSRLGVHLRFGTVSIRSLANRANLLSKAYLNELIWRDFYSMVLQHFPHVVSSAFKPEYDSIPWRDAPEDLERWKTGTTGYPMVDAGMRELAATGYMHNRVRMVVASFLTKHLMIDWRQGEAWFAEKLLDYDLASNNGGWQWAAGTGCDAQPYFRIFNPSSQQEKFDPQQQYIRKWLPELGTSRYPQPMVDHSQARERALDTFKRVLSR